jgi:hypothetical protein
MRAGLPDQFLFLILNDCSSSSFYLPERRSKAHNFMEKMDFLEGTPQICNGRKGEARREGTKLGAQQSNLNAGRAH